MTEFPNPEEPIDAAPRITDEGASPRGAEEAHDSPDRDQSYAPAPNEGPPEQEATPGTGAPQGYPPYASVRRVYRSRHDQRLGGVSAGIAEYFRIDPTIVRLGTLLFALTGVGILVYLAAWYIIPLRPDGFVEPQRAARVTIERNQGLVLGIAALVVAFGIITGSWQVLAIALIGGGLWLLSEHPGAVPSSASAAPPPGDEPLQHGSTNYEPSPSFVAAPQGHSYDSQDTGASHQHFSPPPPNWDPEAPVRERKPQRVTWLVLSLLGLLAAVGISAAFGDWWDVHAARLVGIGIVTIGVGVVIGQIRGGGARGLIPLGILGTLLLFPVSAVDGLLSDGLGSTGYRPTTAAELRDTYEHGIGQLTVDLSQLELGGTEQTVDVDLGIGELIVIVSEDAGGQAVLQAKAGEVSHQLPDTKSFTFDRGVNIESGTVLLQGEGGILNLNIDVGFGSAELRSQSD